MNPYTLTLGLALNTARAEVSEKVLSDLKGYQNIYALIINGDSVEDRHTGNVSRAKEALEAQGIPVQNLFIVSDHALNNPQFGMNHVYSSFSGRSTPTLDDAVSDIKTKTRAGDLLVVYTTGHGDAWNDGCIILPDACVSSYKLIEMLSFMKERDIEGIFIFDQCYSGTFPDNIIDAGITAKAMAPVAEGQESQCQLFTPYFWDAVKNAMDTNNSGRSTFSDAFAFAMDYYQASEVRGRGVYRETLRELTAQEYDSLFTPENQVLLDIGATWCGPCKVLEPKVAKMKGIYGDTVEIRKLTTDTNRDGRTIEKKLGIEVTAIPMLVFWDGKKVYVEEPTSEEGLQALMERYFSGAITDEQKKSVMTKHFCENMGTPFVPYPNHFTVEDIANMISRDVPPQRTYGYDKRFTGRDVGWLALKVPCCDPIPPEIANAYPQKFDGEIIRYLGDAHILPQQAEELLAELQGNEREVVYAFAALDRSQKKALLLHKFKNDFLFQLFYYGFIGVGDSETHLKGTWKYSKEWKHTYMTYYPLFGFGLYDGFSSVELAWFNYSGWPEPDEAKTFQRRFTAQEIEKILEIDGSENYNLRRPSSIYLYESKFTIDDIVRFLEKGISPGRANEYDDRFTAEDIIALNGNVTGPIAPQLANLFDNNMTSRDIKQSFYLDKGIPQKITEKYGDLPSWYLFYVVENGFPQEKIQEFHPDKYKQNNSTGARILIENGIPPEVANSYPDFVPSSAVAKLVKDGIPPNKIPVYDNFDLDAQSSFITNGLLPDIVNQYDPRWGINIIDLVKAGVSPETANQTLQEYPNIRVYLLIEYFRGYATLEDVQQIDKLSRE